MNLGPQRALTAPLALTVAEIFREHGPYLWRALLGLGVRSGDVDDACQEVFVVVHRRLKEFDGRALRSWLYAICLRVASEYRRSARVRREVMMDELPEAPSAAPQLESVHSQELWSRLQGALDTLDDDKRAAFVLYEIEELTLREVSAAIGCPLQTAYSRLNSAREQVRQQLAATEVER